MQNVSPELGKTAIVDGISLLDNACFIQQLDSNILVELNRQNTLPSGYVYAKFISDTPNAIGRVRNAAIGYQDHDVACSETLRAIIHNFDLLDTGLIDVHPMIPDKLLEAIAIFVALFNKIDVHIVTPASLSTAEIIDSLTQLIKYDKLPDKVKATLEHYLANEKESASQAKKNQLPQNHPIRCEQNPSTQLDADQSRPFPFVYIPGDVYNLLCDKLNLHDQSVLSQANKALNYLFWWVKLNAHGRNKVLETNNHPSKQFMENVRCRDPSLLLADAVGAQCFSDANYGFVSTQKLIKNELTFAEVDAIRANPLPIWKKLKEEFQQTRFYLKNLLSPPNFYVEHYERLCTIFERPNKRGTIRYQDGKPDIEPDLAELIKSCLIDGTITVIDYLSHREDFWKILNIEPLRISLYTGKLNLQTHLTSGHLFKYSCPGASWSHSPLAFALQNDGVKALLAAEKYFTFDELCDVLLKNNQPYTLKWITTTSYNRHNSPLSYIGQECNFNFASVVRHPTIQEGLIKKGVTLQEILDVRNKVMCRIMYDQAVGDALVGDVLTLADILDKSESYKKLLEETKPAQPLFHNDWSLVHYTKIKPGGDNCTIS